IPATIPDAFAERVLCYSNDPCCCWSLWGDFVFGRTAHERIWYPRSSWRKAASSACWSAPSRSLDGTHRRHMRLRGGSGSHQVSPRIAVRNEFARPPDVRSNGVAPVWRNNLRLLLARPACDKSGSHSCVTVRIASGNPVVTVSFEPTVSAAAQLSAIPLSGFVTPGRLSRGHQAPPPADSHARPRTPLPRDCRLAGSSEPLHEDARLLRRSRTAKMG